VILSLLGKFILKRLIFGLIFLLWGESLSVGRISACWGLDLEVVWVSLHFGLIKLLWGETL
jgi:hypothetical protein